MIMLHMMSGRTIILSRFKNKSPKSAMRLMTWNSGVTTEKGDGRAALMPRLLAGVEGLYHGTRNKPNHDTQNCLEKEPVNMEGKCEGQQHECMSQLAAREGGELVFVHERTRAIPQHVQPAVIGSCSVKVAGSQKDLEADQKKRPGGRECELNHVVGAFHSGSIFIHENPGRTGNWSKMDN